MYIYIERERDRERDRERFLGIRFRILGIWEGIYSRVVGFRVCFRLRAFGLEALVARGQAVGVIGLYLNLPKPTFCVGSL